MVVFSQWDGQKKENMQTERTVPVKDRPLTSREQNARNSVQLKHKDVTAARQRPG